MIRGLSTALKGGLRSSRVMVNSNLNLPTNMLGARLPNHRGFARNFSDTGKTRDNSHATPISWPGVAAMVLAGSGLVFYFQYTKDNRPTVEYDEPVGKPLLGGPFDLVDDDGKKVTSEDLKGKYLLLYFGFTYCPDICPTELAKMMAVLETIKKTPGLPSVTPVFISIDPERDTKQRLKEYKKNYSPDMLWLTGPIEKIDEVAKAYRCYYYIPTEDERQGDNDYLVDHSIFFYLINQEGDFLDFFGKNLTPEEVSVKMVKSLKRDERTAAVAKK